MLMDRTNGLITLSMHQYTSLDANEGAGILDVDQDSDSSISPFSWVVMALSDDKNDSTVTRLTYDEAGLLHDRLSLILGREQHHA